MGKHIWGAVASILTFIAGLWLMQAPFAFGYQLGGARWASSTRNDVWIGLAIAVLSLLGVLLFIQSLLVELRFAGVIGTRHAPWPAAASQSAAPAGAGATAAGVAAPAGADNAAELERVLVPLATALLADIAERRKHTGAPPILGRIDHPATATHARSEGEGR